MARALAITLALLGLVAGSFALRARGLDYLVPRTFLDGTVIIHQVHELREKPPAERGGALWRYYPLLYAEAVTLLPDPNLAAVEAREGVRPRSAEEHVQLAGAQWVQARQVANLLSLLLVPATFLLARRFLGLGASLFSAAMVATSLLHMRFGTMVRPHGLASSLMLASLLASLWARRRGSPLAILCAGALAGLAIGSLHYGVFVLPPLVLAVWLRGGGTRKAAYAALAGAALVIALILRWLYPFHFEGASGFLSLQATQEGGVGLNLSGQPLKLSRFNGSGLQRVLIYLWGYEPHLLVLVPLGLGIALARWLRGARLGPERAREAWVLAAFVVPYALVLALYAETWERFLLVLLPFFAGAAALSLSALYRRRRGLAVAAGALVLSVSLSHQWRLGSLRAAPDTADELGAWIRATLAPRRDRLQLLSYDDLPLLYTRAALRENQPWRWGSWWVRYQLKLEAAQRSGDEWMVLLPPGEPARIAEAYRERPLEFLRDNRARYAILKHEPDWRTDFASSSLRSARAALRASAPPLLELSPVRAGGPSYLEYQASQDAAWSRPYWWGLWNSERLGASFEVYELEP